MTDTDKLKRLAEDYGIGGHFITVDRRTILALIAENERLKRRVASDSQSLKATRQIGVNAARNMSEAFKDRDEAVELLVPLANMATVCGNGGDDSVYVGQSGIRLTYGDFRRAFALLARIDAKASE